MPAPLIGDHSIPKPSASCVLRNVAREMGWEQKSGQGRRQDSTSGDGNALLEPPAAGERLRWRRGDGLRSLETDEAVAVPLSPASKEPDLRGGSQSS
jgi:hypothetical protein